MSDLEKRVRELHIESVALRQLYLDSQRSLAEMGRELIKARHRISEGSTIFFRGRKHLISKIDMRPVQELFLLDTMFSFFGAPVMDDGSVFPINRLITNSLQEIIGVTEPRIDHRRLG